MGLHEIPTADPSSTPQYAHKPIISPPGNTTTYHTRRIKKNKKTITTVRRKSHFTKTWLLLTQNGDSFFFFFLHDIMTASTKGTATFLAFPIDSLCLCFAIYFTSGDTGYYSSQLLQNTLAIHPDKIPFLQLAGLPSPDSSSSSCSKSADSQLAFNAHH